MEEISASWSSGGSSVSSPALSEFPYLLQQMLLAENGSLGLADPQRRAPSSYGRVSLPGCRKPQSHRPHVVGGGGGWPGAEFLALFTAGRGRSGERGATSLPHRGPDALQCLASLPNSITGIEWDNTQAEGAG